MADSAVRVDKPKASANMDDPFKAIKGYSDEVARLKSVAKAVHEIASGRVKVGSLPVGIMLSGQPGMGKTTMAKAFAKATGLPCVETDSVLTIDVIHSLYEKAKQVAPAVILIDDVDKIVPEEDEEGYTSDESRATLKELISQLDGLSKADRVLTVMTTNAYDALDPALKRPGRVDIHIPIGRPNDADRREILAYYMSQYGDALDFGGTLADIVAKKAYLLSCAALKTLVNDVWLQNYEAFYEKGYGCVDWVDAFQRRILEFRGDGLLKREIKNEEEYRLVCYHEAGHALVEYVLTGNLSDICVLQIASSPNGGWTAPRINDNTRMIWKAADCRNEIACALGGMAAEMIKYGEHSLGVSLDVSYALNLISDMLSCDIPFSGFLCAPASMPGDHYSDSGMTTEGYRQNIQMIYKGELNAGLETAKKAISDNLAGFEALADALYEHGIVSGESLELIIKNNSAPSGA